MKGSSGTYSQRCLSGTELKKARRATRRKYREIGGNAYEMWKEDRRMLLKVFRLSPHQKRVKWERMMGKPRGSLKDIQASLHEKGSHEIYKRYRFVP